MHYILSGKQDSCSHSQHVSAIPLDSEQLWKHLWACRIQVLLRPSKVQIGPFPFYLGTNLVIAFALCPPSTTTELPTGSAFYFLFQKPLTSGSTRSSSSLSSISAWGWPSLREAEPFCCSFILTLWTGQCASCTWLIFIRQWWREQTELHMELLATDVRNNHTCLCSRGQNWNRNYIFSGPLPFVPPALLQNRILVFGSTG